MRKGVIPGLLVAFLAGPALAHNPDQFDVAPESVITATFGLSTVSGDLATSSYSNPFAGSIEVNYPPGQIIFGIVDDSSPVPVMLGIGSAMTDVAFNDIQLGSFDLKGWSIDLVTVRSENYDGMPLAPDGSFAMANHELRIHEGRLTGNLTGIGAFERDFAQDPIRLTLGSALTGYAFGDTAVGGGSFLSFKIPFDHHGSLAGSSDSFLTIAIRGELDAGGTFTAVPEPNSAWPIGASLIAVGLWWRRRTPRNETPEGRLVS